MNALAKLLGVAGIVRNNPKYLGDEGTWTERGPVGYIQPVPSPLWIGTTLPFTNAVGLDAIRTLIYYSPSVAPTGALKNPMYPAQAGIGPWGQPLMPANQSISFFGTGG